MYHIEPSRENHFRTTEGECNFHTNCTENTNFAETVQYLDLLWLFYCNLQAFDDVWSADHFYLSTMKPHVAGCRLWRYDSEYVSERTGVRTRNTTHLLIRLTFKLRTFTPFCYSIHSIFVDVASFDIYTCTCKISLLKVTFEDPNNIVVISKIERRFAIVNVIRDNVAVRSKRNEFKWTKLLFRRRHLSSAF